jgi:hypothetical protein
MGSEPVCSRRELAYRDEAGLEVALYWDPVDDRTSVELRHVRSDTVVRFDVPGHRALDAFTRPLLHLADCTPP